MHTHNRPPLSGGVPEVLSGGGGDGGVRRSGGEGGRRMLLPGQVQCKLMIVYQAIPILVASEPQ